MANRTKIEKLEELIRDTIEGELVEQHASPLLPPGENYGSVMYKVDFKVKQADGEIKEYHAVAKCTPLNTVTQEIFNTQETFKSEIAWYTTVIPTLKKFAKDQGLERELDFFQRFYGARISLDPKSEKVDLDGVILTENLKYLGYDNIDRHQGFDAPTTYSILRDLATFHAVSLVLRVKNPELFQKNVVANCSKFKEVTGEMKESFDTKLLSIFEDMADVQPYMDRITKSVRGAFMLRQKPDRDPWTSILHMDLWCNNIMVTGGENSRNIFLDFQVPMTGSAMCDLIFFLLTSVNLNVIKTALDEFIRFYYDELIKNLTQLQMDPNLFSFDAYLEEIAEAVRASEFSHSLGHAQIILQDKGVTMFDSSDAEFKMEKFDDFKMVPNEKQLEKLRWIALEVAKRNWI